MEELVSTGPDKGNEFPSVVFNQNGDSLYVVWQRDLGNGSYDILFRKRIPSGWSAIKTVTAGVAPPAGTLPQPVISVKRSGVSLNFKMRILVIYIASNNALKYKYSQNEGQSWTGELTLTSSGRFRPSLSQGWGLNVTGANKVDVTSDTGVKIYTRRWRTNVFDPRDPEFGWNDVWDSEELVPASSDPSYISVTNAQVNLDAGQSHLDVVWELDQDLGQGLIEAICYQRKSFFTYQWSAMQEFVGNNFEKPTITTLDSKNLILVWTDGTDIFQAKYTFSTNSWSGVNNLGSGVDPPISTGGGNDEPDKGRYIFRDEATFPYPIKTQTGPAFQKVIAGGSFLPETYGRRISAADTLNGAGFLVEMETPKIKTTNGYLYEIPFVVTNDTLLNLSLNNLASYLNTQNGTLPLDSDSLILNLKIHSKNAGSLGAAGNLIPTVRIQPEGLPGQSVSLPLANLKVTPKLIQRKSVAVRAFKGQVGHLEMDLHELNKTRSSLIPVLTHVHYINQNRQLTKGVLDNRGTLIEVPKEFSLEQNYPNPFNPSTVIRYAISKAGFVTIRIFNLNGQEIVTLVEKNQAEGRYQIQWDGRHSQGEFVAAGMYFYRLEVDEFSAVKRMILLK